nr:double-stranded RNA-binding protein 2-like [Ipomoea batatas]
MASNNHGKATGARPAKSLAAAPPRHATTSQSQRNIRPPSMGVAPSVSVRQFKEALDSSKAPEIQVNPNPPKAAPGRAEGPTASPALGSQVLPPKVEEPLLSFLFEALPVQNDPPVSKGHPLTLEPP